MRNGGAVARWAICLAILAAVGWRGWHRPAAVRAEEGAAVFGGVPIGPEKTAPGVVYDEPYAEMPASGPCPWGWTTVLRHPGPHQCEPAGFVGPPAP